MFNVFIISHLSNTQIVHILVHIVHVYLSPLTLIWNIIVRGSFEDPALQKKKKKSNTAFLKIDTDILVFQYMPSQIENFSN